MRKSVSREEREEAILLSLKKLDFLSRSQLQRLHNLGKDANARRVLREMEPYLSWFREGEKVYYLSALGRQRVGCQKIRKRTPRIRHYLMRNEIYIAYGRPFQWQNEMKIEVKGVVSIICDALFKKNGRLHFVEVDYAQKMAANRTKIEQYRRLKDTGAFQREYSHFPRLIWVTTTEYRRKQLEKMCEGLEAVVHTIDDFK